MAENTDEERVTVTQAMKILGVSKKKMADLISKGKLEAIEDPLDRRYKLIRRADVERLLRQSGKKVAA